MSFIFVCSLSVTQVSSPADSRSRDVHVLLSHYVQTIYVVFCCKESVYDFTSVSVFSLLYPVSVLEITLH